MSPARDNSHAVVQLRRSSSSCSRVFPEHCGSSLYRKRTRSAVVGGEDMKVCCPLTPLLEKKTKATTQARCLAYECNGNHCADVKAVATAADFVNCSSFYANIYPTKISTKVRSINSNVLPLTEQQGSLSSSLPDLASVNAPTYRAAATSNELTFDGENFSPTDLTMTMLSAGERKKLSKSVDDALVDSPRSFDLWQKNCGSSSSFSNTGSDNNKNGYGDEPCNSVLGKTNSLHGDDHNSQSGEEYSGETTQSSSHDLSSQTQNHCQQELNEKKSSLPGKQYLPGSIGHRVKTSSMSSLSVAIEQQTHANETLSSCVCNEISSEDEKSSKKNDEMPSSDWPPTVRTIEAHQLIDVEKEEEVLRQASMVSKGLYKQEETPPSQTTVDCREVIIEDVSDEEFQHKEVDNNCAAVDLEPPQDTGSKKKKIPKLNLDDPLLKGFEVALDKISSSNGDLASANSSAETVPPGDDPITKRAIERLDRKLQEVLKAGSNRLTANSPSWQEKLPTLNSQASNGATEEVVQLRKQVKRPPTPKRRSAQSPCVLPNEEAGQKKDAPQTTDETSVGIAKSLVTVEVNAPEGGESLCPTTDETSNGNKGIYKATFITPILRRKKSPPRPTLGTLRTSVISDDEPLDLRSFRSGHSDRVFSVPSSPVWPRFASRFMEPVPPTNSSFPQPLSSFDYHRSHCLPNSVETAGILRNDRYTPIGIGYNDSDRTMAQSPHQVLPDGDIWRWPNRDLNYHHPSSYEQVPVEHSPMQYRLGDSLSSMRVTSRRPLHAREQLRVFTDRPPSTTHLSSHFRSNSGELSSFMEQQSAPYTSSFRNYVGPSFLGSSQDPVDPIAKKALERFDCCTTNSPRTFGSSTPSTMLANSNSSYDTYQDPIVRSAVMRMDNQLAAAYTANRRPDYTNSLSRRSSVNYVDTCDTIPESVNPLLSLRENGTSGSMAALGPKISDGLRSREGSVPNTSLVDQLENRSAHNMRHIFNYLEDHDFKLSHSQSTLKQTPSRQYFSCSREYTRPRVRPGEISTRDGKSERLSQDPARTATDLERTPPQTRSYNDRLPPKHASDRQDGPLSEQLNDKQYLRTASSYSNLYIPKDVPGEGSSSVDFDSSVISATPEGPEASSGSVRAEASPAHPGIRQTVQIPISRQHSRRGQRPQKSGEHNDTPTADRCRSLERTPSNASGFAKGPRTIAVSGSPRVSPARNRRGLSVSTGQPKASRNGRSNGQSTVDNGARRKLDQKIPQPAGRLKQQQALLGRRAQTPRLSVVSNNTPKQSGEPEQDCWNGGRTTPLKWQMSVFERLYYNRKR